MAVNTNFPLMFLVFMSLSCALGEEPPLMRQLVERIEGLERQGEEQKAINQKLAVALAEHETEVELYRKRIEKQERRIRYLEETVNLLRAVDGPKKLNESYAVPTDKAMTINNSISDEKYSNTPRIAGTIRKYRLVMDDYEGPVAFHATTDKGEVPNLGIGQHIALDQVLINLGNGYHSQHGLFIAPKAGIYIFSASIMSYKNAHPEIWISIVKNGSELGKAYAHGDSGRHDQGSVTVVTQLSLADEVWIRLSGPAAGDSFWGDRCTSFMGYLLQPM